MSLTEGLSDLFGSITVEQASYKVHARATFYPNFVRVFIPQKPYDKLLPGMEASKSLIRTKNVSKQNSEEDFERSLRRTKKTIRDYVLCNQFGLLATFTFKHDRQNTPKSKIKMSNWIKNQQKRKGKFEYLIIPEFHHDQQSLHFHALIKNYTGKLKPAINPKTKDHLKQKGRQIYTLPSYRLGFTNVIKIDDSPESHAKVASYVGKYITKDMPRIFGKNRYWASGGLRLPRTQDNPPDWYLRKPPLRAYSSEFGITLDFTLSSASEESVWS